MISMKLKMAKNSPGNKGLESFGSEQPLFDKMSKDEHGDICRQSLKACDWLACITDAVCDVFYDELYKGRDVGGSGRGYISSSRRFRFRLITSKSLIGCLS